jgi:hypothetical protein
MMYEFPDAELAIKEVLTDYQTVFHLTKDYDLPIVQILSVPSSGQVSNVLMDTRLQLDVRASGRTEAKRIANAITTLLNNNTFATSHGLLDRVDVTNFPYEQPTESETENVFTLLINVATRPLPNS